MKEKRCTDRKIEKNPNVSLLKERDSDYMILMV